MMSIPYAIALIPARGGSKRIPRKNLLPLAGLPLVAHSIRHAIAAHAVSEVYVSTDDPEIADVARTFGAEVVMRPTELAGDQATSESALLHALDDRARRGLPDPELVVFLQPTSPVRRLPLNARSRSCPIILPRKIQKPGPGGRVEWTVGSASESNIFHGKEN